MSNYEINAVDLVDEMLHRTDSMVYMLDALRKEINLLPEITKLNECYFGTLMKCLNTAELLNYSNLEKLQGDEKRLNAEQAPLPEKKIRAA